MMGKQDNRQSAAGSSMKWLIDNAMAYFGHNDAPSGTAESRTEPDLILSGYAFEDRGEPRDSEAQGAAQWRQAGILYAGIDDYARLAQQEDDGTRQRLSAAIKAMMSHVGANGGSIVHLAGDAILAEFKDADSALHCAISVQLAARQWNADLAFERRVRFRIGVSFGDAISPLGGPCENASDLVARLERFACAGGICVSETASHALEANSSIRLVPMGRRYVPNLDEPVQAFWIEIDAREIVDPEHTGAVRISAMAS